MQRRNRYINGIGVVSYNPTPRERLQSFASSLKVREAVQEKIAKESEMTPELEKARRERIQAVLEKIEEDFGSKLSIESK